LRGDKYAARDALRLAPLGRDSRDARRYTQVFVSRRHPGRDSCQAILPDTLWVNANPFQTDLCRDPEAMDGNVQVGSKSCNAGRIA